MLKHGWTAGVLMALMIVSSGAAYALRPTQMLAAQQPEIDLSSLLPNEFGDWRVDASVVPVAVPEDVRARLNDLYSQLISRTYVNGDGLRVMLSIAYGGNQAGETSQVHRPEYCYASQGFLLRDNQAGAVESPFGALPVRRLIAVSGARHEPITYWLTVGEKITLPGLGRKLAQLKYGLTGVVPDGLLFRVSSISADSSDAYRLQEQFVIELLNASPADLREKLIGRVSL